MTHPTPEADTRFFVAHMQKTAGTTLRDRLRSTFTEDQIYPNGNDGDDARISVISVKHLEACWAARGHEIRLLTGHFPVRTVELLPGDINWVTMTVLREPVERVLSFLRHQAARRQRGATEDTPITEIYADPFRFEAMLQNHMTRMLSMTPEEIRVSDGVLGSVAYTEERLDMAKEALFNLPIFGLQHLLDHFCSELSSQFGLDTGASMRSNTTEPGEIPPGFVDRIAEDNRLDMELFAYACRLYEERHPEPQPEANP
ncbi:MAG: hypothetical protein ABIP03_11545 [Aquihabitans sp.]